MELLTELILSDPNLQISEDHTGVRLRLPFLIADTVNKNNRRYPLAVVKSAISKLKERIAQRTAYGSSAHLKELESHDVSHMIEDVSLEGNTAYATVRVLYTTKGRDVLAILRGGGRLGVSARGVGNTKKDEKGVDVVENDYRLDGFDWVLNPSFELRAGREQIIESAPIDQDEAPRELTEEERRTLYRQALYAGWSGTLEEYIDMRQRDALQKALKTATRCDADGVPLAERK